MLKNSQSFAAPDRSDPGRLAERRDSTIAILVRDALLREPILDDLSLFIMRHGQREDVRVSRTSSALIALSVANGVVTLDGPVPGMMCKRVAGVLAWWVPYSRDVFNHLAVTGPEQDNDVEMANAIRAVFDRDASLNASHIELSVRDRNTVLLTGVAASARARFRAEENTWYVFGVGNVINRISVRS